MIGAHAIELQRIIERLEVVGSYLYAEEKPLGETAFLIRNRLVQLRDQVDVDKEYQAYRGLTPMQYAKIVGDV